ASPTRWATRRSRSAAATTPTSIPATPSTSPCAACTAACSRRAAISVGIDTHAIEDGIRSLQTVRGRFEYVGAPSPDAPAVIVDYAHKPDALEKLLAAVRDLAPESRLWVVFGCGGDRDKGKRPKMGEIAARMAD